MVKLTENGVFLASEALTLAVAQGLPSTRKTPFSVNFTIAFAPFIKIKTYRYIISYYLKKVKQLAFIC